MLAEVQPDARSEAEAVAEVDGPSSARFAGRHRVMAVAAPAALESFSCHSSTKAPRALSIDQDWKRLRKLCPQPRFTRNWRGTSGYIL